MTKAEFGPVIAYLCTGFSKPVETQLIDVYFDALADMPLDILQLAAKRVLMQQKWFPTVYELREAAAETVAGEVKTLSPAEAWALAWKAAGSIDLEMNGLFIAEGKEWTSQAEWIMSKLPPLVVEAMKTYSLSALCYGKEPVGVIRGQFTKIYEQLQARTARERLLPPAVKEQIAGAGRERLREQLKCIGSLPD